jgi:hypothetical protein
MYSAIILAAVSAVAHATMLEANGKDFDWDQAEISRQLSVVSYCGHKQYETHDFSGKLEGFEWHYTIYNSWHDVEGFMGYLPSDESIYISF